MRRVLGLLLLGLFVTILTSCASTDTVSEAAPLELKVCVTASSGTPAVSASCASIPIERP